MNKILEENLKPRTLIVYVLFGVASILMLKQLQLPDFLKDLIMLTQGYWAGSRLTQAKQINGGQSK
jgi:hypothetical protein